MGTVQTWNATYENSPTDGSSPANGDDELRNLKTTIKTFNNKEHWHGYEVDDGSNQNLITFQGAHRAGSAMPFIQATAPTAPLIGGSWDYYHDYGRLWIDMGNEGRLMYLYFEDEDDLTPEWKPVISYSVGEVAAFVVNPDVEERWVSCDGRTITKSDVSPDGTTAGYSALIDALFLETGGDANHPFYVQADGNAAKLPDLRGVGLRGADDMAGAGSVQGAAGRDTAGRVNNDVDEVSAANTVIGSFQDDKILDHAHLIDHAHGATVVDGNDSGDGRTGDVESWSGGVPTFADGDGSHTHTFNDTAVDGDSDSPYVATGPGSDDAVSYSNHTHDIARYNGLSRDISSTNGAADTSLGLPERDYSYADENVMKNSLVYWMIRY